MSARWTARSLTPKPSARVLPVREWIASVSRSTTAFASSNSRLGLLVGGGYAASVSLTNAVTPNTPRPLLLSAVTASYHVVGTVAVSTLVVALR